jgi:predicted TPR repeat methyltransferase
MLNNSIGQNRLYKDLAWIWPIMSPPEHYTDYAETIHRLIQAHARRDVKTLLELGCGGGHTASHLKKHYRIAGIDLSPAMLENASRLNPEIHHLVGDMRTVRLDSRFDAVLIHDAINYMLTEADLEAAFRTVWAHLEPGGVFVTQIEQLAGGLVSYGYGGKPHVKGDVRLVYFEEIGRASCRERVYRLV